jgi:hypothetical protein
MINTIREQKERPCKTSIFNRLVQISHRSKQLNLLPLPSQTNPPTRANQRNQPPRNQPSGVRLCGRFVDTRITSAEFTGKAVCGRLCEIDNRFCQDCVFTASSHTADGMEEMRETFSLRFITELDE